MYKVVVPILGFENVNEMKLKAVDDDFAILQLDKEKHINMHLISTNSFKDLDFEIDDNFMKKLEINNDSNFKIYFSLVVNTPLNKSVINLTAPIVVNEDKKTMGQTIIKSNLKKLFITLDEVSAN